MNTPDLLNRLADIVSRLRHMWDDTDGDTHMPVEESDDISAIGTEIASLMGCPDSWSDISDALQSHAATIDHAERVESETAGALAAAVTAAHAGDLSAASDAATCALALLGLDSAFRVRVERAASLAPGLPKGWTDGGVEVCNGGETPEMPGEVRPWRVGHDDNPYPTLGAYLTAEGAGTWNADACCDDLIPGVTLDGYANPLEARLRTPRTYTRIAHPTARTAEDIARLARDLPALRAWLLSELDAARVVVGGAP